MSFLTPTYMNITSKLSIATAFVALSISAHAAEVFSFAAIDDDYPTAKSSTEFNAVDENGVRTYPYNTYGNTDAGTSAGWGGAVVTNFDGTTPVANPVTKTCQEFTQLHGWGRHFMQD